jgi:hypothetical protein
MGTKQKLKNMGTKSKQKLKNNKTKRKYNVKFINTFKYVMKKGSFLYHRKSHKNYELRRNTFEWFALDTNYGSDTYGIFYDGYILTKDITLFDLGVKGARKFLMEKFQNVQDKEDLCDFQYSGGVPNKKFHNAINLFLKEYKFNGTFVTEETDSLDCGPTEVVLSPNTTLKHEKYIKRIETNYDI